MKQEKHLYGLTRHIISDRGDKWLGLALFSAVFTGPSFPILREFKRGPNKKQRTAIFDFLTKCFSIIFKLTFYQKSFFATEPTITQITEVAAGRFPGKLFERLLDKSQTDPAKLSTRLGELFNAQGRFYKKASFTLSNHKGTNPETNRN